MLHTQEGLHIELLKLPLEDATEFAIHKMVPQLEFHEIMGPFDRLRSGEVGMHSFLIPPVFVRGQAHRLQLLRTDEGKVRASLEYRLSSLNDPEYVRAEEYSHRRWGQDLIQDEWWSVIKLLLLEPASMDPSGYAVVSKRLVLAMENGWEQRVVNESTFFSQIRVCTADPICAKEVNKSNWVFRYACGYCGMLLAGPARKQECAQCGSCFTVDMRTNWYWSHPFQLPKVVMDEAKRAFHEFRYWDESQTKPLELPHDDSAPS